MRRKKKAKGMALEDKINKVNLRYRKNNQALIVKKSTPLKVTAKGLIYQKSTVDYSGIYKDKQGNSKAVSFDAKECSSLTAFPLSNIEEHQIAFLDFFYRLGGDAFVLIHFTKLDKCYKISIDFITNFIASNKRKSIPIKDFKDEWLIDIEDYLNLELD